MSLPLEIAAVLAAVGTYEAARYTAFRALKRRWQRSIGDFMRRHQVQLEHFRFIDRVWVRQTLLQDPEIDRLAADRAATSGETLYEVRARIEAWLDEIVPFFNLFSYYKIGATAARAAVRVCYEPVFDDAALARARAAIPPGTVTVYVANHRSNADYVVLSVGTLRQVALSYAVGEWARVWPLDSLFRSFGSYFVRRGEKDPLYHRVLARYLQLVASRGLTTAFFLEGGLSRDGALRPPRIGLLDYLVGILRAEPHRHIAFVPVGINYDRVLEDRHLLGERGPPGVLQKLASLGHILLRAPVVAGAFFGRAALRSHRKYGYAAVAFGPPLFLHDLLPDAAAVAALPDVERRPHIAALADRLLGSVADAVPVTPVSVVAAALLDGALGRSALRQHVATALHGYRAAGRPIAQGKAFQGLRDANSNGAGSDRANPDLAALEADIGSSEEAERTVDLALRLLTRRGLVTLRAGAVTLSADAPPILAYYARSLEPPKRSASAWSAGDPERTAS
ncbi:MAG: 1-acyl-sn-glycerol-3-phosphate acyltransferase [Pseudomonadota bacterium]|nr:1-acyl-sn-glycerol-3-phosphate acyltransferase [Pseudomonadota bacterium]